MNVPIYNRQVAEQAPGVATPHIDPITEGAFGANADEAKANLGKTVSSLGAGIAEYLIAKRNHNEEQTVNDRVTEFTKDATENLLYGKDGALILTGANAKGITPVYDQRVNELKSKYIKDLPPKSAELFNRIADTHANLWRDNVIKNEVDQTNIADEQSIASNVSVSAQTFGSAYGVKVVGEAQAKHDSDMNLLIGKARSEAVDLLKRKGISDPADIKLERQKVDGQFAIEAAKNNPLNADSILASNKFDLSAKDKAQLQGIQVDALQNVISQAALTYKPNADGTPNLANTIDFSTKAAKDKGFTPEQTDQVIKYAHSQVAVATAEIRQNREQNQSKFYNQAIQMFNSGKKQPDIVDALVKKANYDFSGYSATDKQDQIDYINKLFTSHIDAVGKALEYVSPEQKAALAEAKIIIAGKVGATKLKLSGDVEEQRMDAVYEGILNRKVAGSNMSRDEILGYTNDLFKNVEIPGRFWGTNEKPAYQYISEQERAYALSNADLEKVYGSNLVEQAKQALGGNPSPSAIQQAIERVMPKKAKEQEPMPINAKDTGTGRKIEQRAI